MSSRRNVLWGLMLVWLLGGCHTLNTCDECWWYNRTPERKLSQGVEKYEEGNYIASMAALNNVLQTKLLDKNDKVSAYKYLAFIHCVSDREKLCFEAFSKALAIKPDFELTPAEAGHPIWGPVFRKAKSKIAK
ncbi:MAG: TssQ family T6SS-associated lipoprotein [Gammaproteobacteria bacterium]|nr:TssQ family T6SS-associated lipoprotein [Gammaproteobacteria bacterium]MBU1967892.1 TssQ family T6SS-associated lipoprotein [Gammaproteobacteria bacterium]